MSNTTTTGTTTGTANAFILAYRRLAAAPNVKKTTAKALAIQEHPRDYEAYQQALAAGVALPPLDRKPDFEARRERMIRSGILP